MLAFAGSASPAFAAAIQVHPGPNAIQQAVNGADPGDVLRIHGGTYHEDVVVDKQLTLRDAGDGRPVIDGGCTTAITVDIQHRGVILRHLKVVGAQLFYEVNFFAIRTGTARDLVVRETCEGADAAEYGINVFNGGHIRVLDNKTAGGFTDAGIYIGAISDASPGPLVVAGNESRGNNRGIIVEDTVRSADVVVRDNRVHDNTIGGEGHPSGIFLHRSDGVLILDNVANGNGMFGIDLDPDSDHNRLDGNVARHNGTRNFRNQGAGNCGAGNSFSIAPC